MKSKNKKLLTGVSVVLAATIAILGTFAYLQDSKSAANVMINGNVKIEQIEEERVNDSDAQQSLKAFTQAKPLKPSYYPGSSIPWAPKNEWVVTEDEAWKVVADNDNVIDKFVRVKNTGGYDAYVRTIFAVEVGTNADNSNYIHVVSNSKKNIEDIATWDWEWLTTPVVIDGTTYEIAIATYTDKLQPGYTTIPSLKQIYLDKAATNDDVNKFGDTYEILAYTQAVQADMNGLSNVGALNEAFGEITKDNHPWINGADVPEIVDNSDELVASLEDGNDVILTENIKIDPAAMSNAYGKTGINVKNGQTIDGGGNTLDIKGAGGTWDSGINTTGGTIQNIKITGSFRGIFINHNSEYSEPIILNNVVIDGTTYTISCDQGSNQTLKATNSTFNGWTSYAATLGSAEFINCKFGEGNGYAYCRPYAPTTFMNCEFEAGYEMDPRVAVTFENCTLDGVLITTKNLETLVTSNIANATVK